MGRLVTLVRTRETYFEKITNLSLSSRIAKRIAIESFDKFTEKEFNITSCENMISELKNESETVMYDVLQKWINSLLVADIKNRFYHLNSYLYYHGLKITPMDVKSNLTFKKTLKREHYPVKREEIMDIITPVKSPKRALYMALVSTGMRVGEAMQLRKKDLDFSRSRMQITIPAEISKNGVARITWMGKEAEKYNIKHINSLEDDDLIWRSTGARFWNQAVANNAIQFGKYVDNAGLGMRYKSETRKITLHSLRSYFITKGNIIDFGLGHALAGHEYYMKRYDRYTEDDLFEMYLKLEPHLGIFDLTLKNNEISELQKANEELVEIKDNLKQTIKDNVKQMLKEVIAEQKSCEIENKS